MLPLVSIDVRTGMGDGKGSGKKRDVVNFFTNSQLESGGKG
jgi:hypothetical protein